MVTLYNRRNSLLFGMNTEIDLSKNDFSVPLAIKKSLIHIINYYEINDAYTLMNFLFNNQLDSSLNSIHLWMTENETENTYLIMNFIYTYDFQSNKGKDIKANVN